MQPNCYLMRIYYEKRLNRDTSAGIKREKENARTRLCEAAKRC